MTIHYRFLILLLLLVLVNQGCSSIPKPVQAIQETSSSGELSFPSSLHPCDEPCRKPPPDVFTAADVDMKMAQSTFGKVVTGDINVKTNPQVFLTASKAAIDNRIKAYLRCLEIHCNGYTPEQAVYFDQLAAFMETNPTPDQFVKWQERYPFPRTVEKPFTTKNQPVSEETKSEETKSEETTPSPRKIVLIAQPRNADPISGGGEEVSGTYSDQINEDIWVIVWPEKAPGRGWPQSNDAAGGAPAQKKDGRWSVYCYFGGPPQNYDIAVYTATRSASQVLGDKLKEWYGNNDYKGILSANLPDGLIEKYRVQVSKR